MNNNRKSRVSSSHVAFMTRDIVKHDFAHVANINRIIASRNNHANDYRAHALREKISDEFKITSSKFN